MDKHKADLYFETAHRAGIAGDRVGALHFLQLGLLQNPDHGPAWTNRGDLLFAMSDPFEALVSYDMALRAMPDEALIWNARGTCLQLLREYGEAEQCYNKAIALNPKLAMTYSNLGSLLQPSSPEKAISLHREAIGLEPGRADWHFHLALALLRAGQFQEGWRQYEWREKTENHTSGGRRLARPRWKGGSARAVLLYSEQGFGDAIQFMRYAPFVQAKFGIPVYLEVRPQLRRLAMRAPEISEGIAGVLSAGDLLPGEVTHAAPLMSMPLLCETFEERLIPPPMLGGVGLSKVGFANHMLRLPIPERCPRIGLCWSGGDHPNVQGAHEVDGRRSIRLADLAPLAEIDGVAFVSLQTGFPAAEAKMPPRGMVIASWTHEIDDFYDTAQLIHQLDLVITVDTAVAHLAAGMGKKTWLLSRYDNCWRWLGRRDDSPWYPTLRQFVQPIWGDWDTVIKRVAEALRDEVAPGETAAAE
jgi:hypothetical protein